MLAVVSVVDYKDACMLGNGLQSRPQKVVEYRNIELRKGEIGVWKELKLSW